MSKDRSKALILESRRALREGSSMVGRVRSRSSIVKARRGMKRRWKKRVVRTPGEGC